jgi:hypothetical protein
VADINGRGHIAVAAAVSEAKFVQSEIGRWARW